MRFSLMLSGLAFSVCFALAQEQKLCPLMIEDEIDSEEYVEYKGKKIFMCCGSCVKKFKKDPDYYVKLTSNLLPQIDKSLLENKVELNYTFSYDRDLNFSNYDAITARLGENNLVTLSALGSNYLGYFVDNMSIDGYTDWWFPNVTEINSIVTNLGNPYTNTNFSFIII